MINGSRDAYIFKRLKQHYAAIQDKFEVVGIFLQGSQNYGLDIYDEEYISDIDTKAIVLPSLNDIINNKEPISTTIIMENDEHIDVKDVRVMLDTFKKQNINFIEILFTRFRILNPKYAKILKPLFDNAESIARMNYNKALNCQTGLSKQKLVALKHPYPTIKDKIDKYGYDPKQLHHILRMNDFIKKYVSGMSYNQCLIPDNKDYLIQIKKGILPLSEAEKLALEVDNQTYAIAQHHLLEDCVENNECVNILNNVKTDLLKIYFKEQIEKDAKQDVANETPHTKKIFFTSDMHFYHKNILEFENRPFKDVDDMNQQLIKNWNSVVGINDLVYILGDFSFGGAKDTEDILKCLNGYKVLIIGNHDDFLNSKKFDKSLFLNICHYDEVSYMNKCFALCHYPFASNDSTKYQLYGHIHSNSNYGKHSINFDLPKNSYNVGVDVNNYTPVYIDTILNIFKEQENG